MEVSRTPELAVGPLALWSWRLKAACRDIDSAIFFSPDRERDPERSAREARAKAICARCPVIGECATYAIGAGERYGVWGGLSERERAAVRLGA
jgi:WhiB family redox-sensing transcriptional regulator